LVRFSIHIPVPDLINRVTAAPMVLLRRLWYGYTFRRIKLNNYKKCAIVEPADYYQMSRYTWYVHLDSNKKVICAVRFSPEANSTKPVSLHRQIMIQQLKIKNSKLNISHVVDHINNDPLDNRRCNLRVITNAQNTLNRSPMKNKSSKYKGVCKRKDSKKYSVQIFYQGRAIRLGTFESEIDAAKAYDAAAKKYHKEFAYLNFPENNEKGLKNILKRLQTIE
jgi:hypothetical protein